MLGLHRVLRLGDTLDGGRCSVLRRCSKWELCGVVKFFGGGCSGLEDAQEGCNFGETWHAAVPRLGCPAYTSPPRYSHSLQRAAEQQEQRLALAEDGQAAAGREAAELRATLRGLERGRLDARRELQELRRQVQGERGTQQGDPLTCSLNHSLPSLPRWGR